MRTQSVVLYAVKGSKKPFLTQNKDRAEEYLKAAGLKGNVLVIDITGFNYSTTYLEPELRDSVDLWIRSHSRQVGVPFNSVGGIDATNY